MKGTLSQPPVAPVRLTAGSAAALRPVAVPEAEIVSGFWAQRQQANSAKAIPAGPD